MSELKEFANLIILNMANLAAIYDRLLLESDEGSQALVPGNRVVSAHWLLLRAVAEACQTQTSDPLLHLFTEQENKNPRRRAHSIDPLQSLTEIDCLTQTLMPVAPNLEAGKFLSQLLSEVRNVVDRTTADIPTPLSSPPLGDGDQAEFSPLDTEPKRPQEALPELEEKNRTALLIQLPAKLKEQDPSQANLHQADLNEANFTEASPSEINLAGTNSSETSLSETDLKGAKLDDTIQTNDKRQPVWKLAQQSMKRGNLRVVNLFRFPQARISLAEARTAGNLIKNRDPHEVRNPKVESAASTLVENPRDVIGALWQKMGIDLATVGDQQPTSGWRILLIVGVALVIVGMGYIFWVRPVLQGSAPTAIVGLAQRPVPAPLPTLATPTPRPATALPLALPSAEDTVANPSFTPTPDAHAIVVAPIAEAVGWVSSVNGQSHFSDPNIHVGFLNGHIYHGAIQFDLSAIPPNATVTSASLELTGLGDQNLSSSGVWQVRLLNSDIDRVWPVLTYDMLHGATVDVNILPALTSAALGRGTVNVYPFGPEQLAVLQQHLANRVVSFRLDGPASGKDSFFTWDSGYRSGELVNAQPMLRIVAFAPEYVIITSTPTPKNVLTAVAMISPPSESGLATETPTPLPAHWVTPIIVTPQPPPANTATATYEAEVAGAETILFGTATPTPLNVWTATPTLLPPDYVIVTGTPTPKNIVTAAAEASIATQVAKSTGTYTPVPENWITPIVVTPRPIPGNAATARYEAEVVTAEAILYGTSTSTPFNVWTATPNPASTPFGPGRLVVVTSTPTPENIVTVVAQAAIATQVAGTTGTYTPVPGNWVTPVVITPMPRPGNTATAEFQAAVATAHAFLYDPDDPTQAAVWTATPTPAFVPVAGEVATPWVSYTPTPAPPAIPPELVGKIAFLSTRSGGEEPLAEPLAYAMNPDGSDLIVLTDRTFYDLAVARDRYSTDQRFRVFVKDALRFDGERVPALYLYDYLYSAEEQITRFGVGLAWDPVWSPTREQIAFVSNDTRDNEIWVVDRDGSNLLRLTDTNEIYNAREIGKDTFLPEVNGHPSWSPDGSIIVFWSNRTGRRQIWVMNADGSNLHNLSRPNHDDWNPVWIKYPDLPRDPRPGP